MIDISVDLYTILSAEQFCKSANVSESKSFSNCFEKFN